MAPLWAIGIQMKQISYFVSGLTTNQKIFLLSNGCGIEQNLDRTYLNYWLSTEGVKVTVKNKQAKAAWDLIQNSDLTVIQSLVYTPEPHKPLSGTRADWVVVDEFDTISDAEWKKLGVG